MAKKQPSKAAKPDLTRKQEGNAFDKLLKEASESTFKILVERKLGVKIKDYQAFKEKVQTTQERETDFLYKVVTEDDERFLLHIEFQTKLESGMVLRLAEYHAMLVKNYKMIVRHVVINLSEHTPNIRTTLTPEESFTHFELIHLHQLDAQELLSSQVPDVVILAILANYPKEQSEAFLRLIVAKLRSVSKSKKELAIYFTKLVMFSRLRKIEDLTIKITEEMPIEYDIATDYLYIQGTKQGMELGIEQGMELGIEQGMELGIEQGVERERARRDRLFVVKLLTTHHTISEITFLADVSEKFVEEVIEELKGEIDN